MEQLKLGRSGFSVSRICLGTNNFGSQLDQDRCNKIMSAAMDLGISIFDTADIYTGGKSEQIIGDFIKDRRNDISIATKVGMEVSNDPNKMGLSRKNIIFQLNQSLKRLQTDYIDLYYVHQFDPQTPLEETMKTLNSLVEAGKIRYIACSNFSAQQIAQSREICEKLGLENFIAIQSRYNVLDREIETDLIPYCVERRIGVLAYSPLLGGLLAGRYEKDRPPPDDSRGKYNQNYWKRVNNEKNFARFEKFRDLSMKLGVSPSVLAIAWILREQKVASAVVGASTPEQLTESCQAMDFKLSSQTQDELKNI